jgi:hypothetical protein
VLSIWGCRGGDCPLRCHPWVMYKILEVQAGTSCSWKQTVPALTLYMEAESSSKPLGRSELQGVTFQEATIFLPFHCPEFGRIEPRRDTQQQ